MKKSNENLTKERRTFTEFMDDNKRLFIVEDFEPVNILSSVGIINTMFYYPTIV